MYHHANSDACSNPLPMLERHLAYIATHFTTVFPGDSLEKPSVCLTFDDGYSDFYFLIFPLLQRYNLKALLAVPSAYLLETCDAQPQTRMGFKHDDLFANWQKGTFCTVEELKIMLRSGLVRIASHGHTHTNLLETDVDLGQELLASKEILEARLETSVESFVFPFGKHSPALVAQAKAHYSYVFRIGNALHQDFLGIHGVNYRVDGDNLRAPDALFTWQRLLKYRFKGWLKRMRRA
ncbi:MAG: polysaccharide deacetylase family protein [Campylobacterales bacterium]|nr:polysaccharide deacetylase family protein [Campylobacterales bacterium]